MSNLQKSNLRTLNLLSQMFKSEISKECGIKKCGGSVTCIGTHNHHEYLCCWNCKYHKSKNGCRTLCIACSMFFCLDFNKNNTFRRLTRIFDVYKLLNPYEHKYYISNKVLASYFTEINLNLKTRIENTLNDVITIETPKNKIQIERILKLIK